MGNAQSSGPLQNRLGKPKTNKNAPSLAANNALDVESPVSLSPRHANLSTKERQQIKSQLLSPVAAEFGYRESFDGDKALGEIAANMQGRVPARANSLSCFGSKASSTTRLSNLPASKVSLVQSSQPVDLQAAISILQEVQKNASPEDVAALQQALQPYASSPSPRAPTAAEPGLSRRTSILTRSTSSLIRRRSLAVTPGVATRDSPIENNRRTWNSWRTPQLDSKEEAKWRQDTMGSSPLTQIALDLAEEGRESPTPRAQTPGDMDYSHLGSLKLGTLRIANGEPSPAASAKLNSNATNAASQEDYFAAVDLSDSPLMMKPTKKRRHVRSRSALQPTTPPLSRTLGISDDARKAKTTSQYAAPPKPKTPEQSCYEDLEAEPVRRLRVMNKSQDTLATMLDSQPEAPKDSSKLSQHVQAEDIDEGFVSDEPLSFREEAIRILDGTIFGGSAPVSATYSPSVGGSASRQRSLNKRPPPKKADSGYSSGGSFRGKKNGARTPSTIATTPNKTPPVIATDSRHSQYRAEKDDSTSLRTLEQNLRLSTPEKPLPPSPADEHVAPHPTNGATSHADKPSNLVLAAPAPYEDELNEFSQSLSTPKTPTSFISHFSLDSISSIQKRLQRRRPSFQELPIVQSCDPIPEGSIPNIPSDVNSQFVRRLSEAPGLECLTRTYPTKNHSNKEASENEIELPALEPIKFPSPPPTPEPRGRHHKRAATERPSSPRRSIHRSLSLFRRKSKAEKEEEHPTLPHDGLKSTALDLGTTATSLGRSPYDVALAAARHDVALTAARRKRGSTATHPHQLGEALPRAKSMVNMDAQTAAKLARLRSKDHALVGPEMAPRPESYYNDKGEPPGSADVYRRHSFYGHVPPMPTIPGIDQLRAAKRPVGPQPPEKSPGPAFRARTAVRGRIVTPLIEKYDKYGQRVDTNAASKSYTVDESTTHQPSRTARVRHDTPRIT